MKEKEAIRLLGRIARGNPANIEEASRFLYRIVMNSRMSNIKPCNLKIKGIPHFTLGCNFYYKSSYYLCANATRSPIINNVKNIYCTDIHTSMVKWPFVNKDMYYEKKLGYYCVSFVRIDDLDFSTNHICNEIAIRNGVINNYEIEKIFNNIILRNNIDLLYKTIAHNDKMKNKGRIDDIFGDADTNRTMIRIDNEDGVLVAKKLENNSLLNFMRDNNYYNIITDISWSDIDEDFIAGVRILDALKDKSILYNIHSYGNEGLDYLNIENNEIKSIIDTLHGSI